jgi:ribosomal protein S18 acetylase RimI-like enzyme
MATRWSRPSRLESARVGTGRISVEPAISTITAEPGVAADARPWCEPLKNQARAFGAVLAQSLGYLGAFAEGALVGFVNVAWDGGAHAFQLDPTVHPDYRRCGLGLRLVREAAALPRAAGAEWLHVDCEPHLQAFYAAAGFQPTAAGLLQLRE